MEFCFIDFFGGLRVERIAKFARKTDLGPEGPGPGPAPGRVFAIQRDNLLVYININFGKLFFEL